MSEWPRPDCCSPDLRDCICPPEERALRGWKGAAQPMPPMTPEQREYCLSEIGQVEGHKRSDHETDSDGELAGAVIEAWTDYARDKGLLP